MCGIAGIVEFKPQGEREDVLALSRRMASALSHRGPDDADAWMADDRTTCLSHRRLSIVDLSAAGRNPMHSHDGRLTISFNGEIYNFLELRQELRAHGYCFRSNSDTEVILAAFDRWGIDCLQRFVGMFAFGLWDAASRRLYIARDRLGKKPLYYAQYHGRFTFASELKALSEDENFPRDVDHDALSLYLRYGYVPSPYAIFRSARKLPPAHYAVLSEGDLSIKRYWDPVAISLEPHIHLTDKDAKESLEALVKDAVRYRLISDVPLGVFLSGGIDSSLVAALMCEVSNTPVRTFSIRFENPKYDEAEHAAAVARHLGTDHHEDTCGMSQLLSLVDELPMLLDEPFADSSILPTYLLSKITREKVTVALAGDGGDELFFGYPRFHAYAKHKTLLHSPANVRHTIAAVLDFLPQRRFHRAAMVIRQDSDDSYARFMSWWNECEIAEAMGNSITESPNYAEAKSRLRSLPRSEQPPVLDLVNYLPEDILTKVDRASMAASLEARAPLLDHRVVEFSLRLPLTMKWRHGESKWLLRQILYDRVPKRLLDRPKMGFGVPLTDWLRGPLRDRMDSAINGRLLEDLGINPRLNRQVWADFLSKKNQRTDVLWSTFALALWAERWLKR